MWACRERPLPPEQGRPVVATTAGASTDAIPLAGEQEAEMIGREDQVRRRRDLALLRTHLQRESTQASAGALCFARGELLLGARQREREYALERVGDSQLHVIAQ